MSYNLQNLLSRRETDWVINTETNEVYQFTQALKELQYTTNLYAYKLWIPQEGEWCVFSTDGMPRYKVAKFSLTSKGYHYSDCGLIHKNIAPLEFLQTLKETKCY